MAATRADAIGYDKVRMKTTHRLGSESARTIAATWRTFVRAEVRKDGSGFVAIERDGKQIHIFTFDPE